MQVRKAMQETAQHLADQRTRQQAINPMWLFLSTFSRIFTQITHGASRLQEVMADRFAVLAYGATNFIDGLTLVIQQGIKMDMQLNKEFVSFAAGDLKHHQMFMNCQNSMMQRDGMNMIAKQCEMLTESCDSGVMITHPVL